MMGTEIFQILPKGAEKMEILLKIDLITDKYIKDNCDSKGNQRESNLSKDEIAGLKSLKKRVADGEILIVPTDKTGKLTVTTPERYIASMQPHVANDVIITWKEKESIERRLNGHCIQLGRILRMGDKWEHWPRIKSAITNHDCHVPVTIGLEKDHKHRPPGQPPAMRPVCLASEANNSQLSQVLAWIVNAITKIADKDEVLCSSTEEMVASLEAVNSDPEARNLSLFSTDVSGMYTALDIKVIAAWLAEEYLQSDLEILNLDTLELALYLPSPKPPSNSRSSDSRRLCTRGSRVAGPGPE